MKKSYYTTQEKIEYFEAKLAASKAEVVVYLRKLEALKAKVRAEEALRSLESRLAALEERDLRDTQKRDTI